MTTADATGFRLFPDDVLFFRDGRPCTRGEDHHLRSLFPPHPSTVYGALRTRRLLDAGVDPAELRRKKADLWNQLPAALRTELGEWLSFGSLELRGPWLVRGEAEILLPIPADLAILPTAGNNTESSHGLPKKPAVPRAERVVRFLPAKGPDGEHSHTGLPLYPFESKGDTWQPWSDPAEPRYSGAWYMTADGLSAWAAGRAPDPSHLVHADELWIEESRVGIGLETDSRSAEDGLLYTFGFIRLRQGVSIGFDVRGTTLRPGRRLVLGGEGRTGWLESGPVLPPPASGEASDLRLAFATPSFSAGGSTLPEVEEHHLRRVGSCVPGYSLVGGWDLAQARPKPLRRALPAGSVFLLRTGSGDPLPLSALHGRNLSAYPDEHLARQGFGLVLAGLEPRL